MSLQAVHLILKVTSPWKISVIFFWFELFFTFKDKISFSTRFKASKTSDEEPATSIVYITLKNIMNAINNKFITFSKGDLKKIGQSYSWWKETCQISENFSYKVYIYVYFLP